jgi:hypothetical protein
LSDLPFENWEGKPYRDLITAVMTTSPIPSHPDTAIIDGVLGSITYHLGNIDVLLLCDGVRTPEHESRRIAYEEYKSKFRLRPHINILEWGESVQQARMLRDSLRYVMTPFVLYIEHDYALTLYPIDWPHIIQAIAEEKANVVRFHNLEDNHPLHQHLMLDCFEGADGHHAGKKICEPPFVCGVPMIRTVQFWGCPHLTTTKWYREQMEDPTKFSDQSYTEIEPALYGHICDAPWEQYKLMVYAPSEPSMRRSQHLGGRGHDKDDPKREFRFR